MSSKKESRAKVPIDDLIAEKLSTQLLEYITRVELEEWSELDENALRVFYSSGRLIIAGSVKLSKKKMAALTTLLLCLWVAVETLAQNPELLKILLNILGATTT